MIHKHLNPIDRFLIEFDKGLRNLTNTDNTRGQPRPTSQETSLSQDECKRSAQLMRVNHAGEVAAQALYHGQSLTAELPEIRQAMDKAAEEEREHLSWCAERLEELGSRRSLLDPLWYAGSFAIGAAAGLAGDRWSLGFVAETERQVVKHLEDHLQKLPVGDHKSRAILEAMKADEQRHGDTAARAGGIPLAGPVKTAMSLVSQIVRRTALWI